MQRFLSIYRNLGAAALLALAAVIGIGAPALAEVQSRYRFKLSNFNGPVNSTWARIALDEVRGEVYLVDDNEVRVFDANGMEIYRFNDDMSLGLIADVAIKPDGDILVLSQRAEATPSILVCDYRGIPVGRFSLVGAPPDFDGLTVDDILIRDERLYLVDAEALKVVAADTQGRFLQGYDIGAVLEIPDERRIVSQIDGFSVDEHGALLFSIPVLFSVYRLSPDGDLEFHRRPGSAPGKFNQVAGLVIDDRGYWYIADRLKSAVLIFDPDFNFVRQFGYRGPKPDNLFGPKYLVLDSRNRLYVSQLRARGVSVFDIIYENSALEGR